MKSRVNFLIVAVVAFVITLFIGNVDVSAKKNSSKGTEISRPALYFSGAYYVGYYPTVIICRELRPFKSMDDFRAAIFKEYDTPFLFTYVDKNGIRNGLFLARFATRKSFILEPAPEPVLDDQVAPPFDPCVETEVVPDYYEDCKEESYVTPVQSIDAPIAPPIYSDGSNVYTPDGVIEVVAPPIWSDGYNLYTPEGVIYNPPVAIDENGNEYNP